MMDPSMRGIYYFGKQSPGFFYFLPLPLPSTPKNNVYYASREISRYRDFISELRFGRKLIFGGRHNSGVPNIPFDETGLTDGGLL